MAKTVTTFYPHFYESRVGKIALLTMDNGEDYKKPTTFNEEALNSLHHALDVIEKEPEVKGLLLTGKPYIFAAGADLTQIPFINTFEQGKAIGEYGHTTFKRIMDLPQPHRGGYKRCRSWRRPRNRLVLRLPYRFQRCHRHRFPGVLSGISSRLGRLYLSSPSAGAGEGTGTHHLQSSEPESHD